MEWFVRRMTQSALKLKSFRLRIWDFVGFSPSWDSSEAKEKRNAKIFRQGLLTQHRPSLTSDHLSQLYWK